MDRQIVNEDEYIAACNQELRQHPYFEEGMEITGVPEGSSGSDLSGYTFKGPEKTRGIVAQVVSSINKKYELLVT
jgi:hypothetical protein